MPQVIPPLPGTPRPGRRRLLATSLSMGLVGAITACGIRFEDDTSDLPLVPTRTPVPAELALVALLAQTRDLSELTGAWTSGADLATRLTTIHTDQAQVLASLLLASGVPAREISASRHSTTVASPSSGGSTAATTGAALTRAIVAKKQAQALTELSTLSGADGALRPTLGAVLAQRAATVTVLTGRPPKLARARDPRWTPAAIAPLLSATRSAQYGFEVVSAQGGGATRRAASAALSTLAVLERQQAAAFGGAGLDPAGYVLPFRVTTATAAAKLGHHIAAGLLRAYGSVLDPAHPANAPGNLVDLVRWLAQAQVLAHTWRSPLAAFPGMAQRT